MQVTPEGFANLARIVLNFAKETCEGKVVFALEGGYHLEGLRDSVREVLKTLRGGPADGRRSEKQREAVDHRMIDPVIRKVKEAQKPFWKNL
jgi:acetoin utilization deacetylase AcuC-like enzyme